MNLREMIFGGEVKASGGGGAYRDSIQAWLPIKNIMGGVVVTRDNRFIKILEVLPVNICLKSAIDRQNTSPAMPRISKSRRTACSWRPGPSRRIPPGITAGGRV